MNEDFKITVDARMRGNMTKMDMALWERDAAHGGVAHANRMAEYAYERIQEVRLEAAGREYREELQCQTVNAISAEYHTYDEHEQRQADELIQSFEMER